MSQITPKRNGYDLGAFINSDLDDLGLDVYEMRVYIHLCRRANDQKRCWGSHKNIAEVCGISVDSVARAIKRLEARGMLEQEPQFREDNSRSTNLITLLGLPHPPAVSGGGYRSQQGGIPLTQGAEGNPYEGNPVLKTAGKKTPAASETEKEKTVKPRNEMMDALCLCWLGSVEGVAVASWKRIATAASELKKLGYVASDVQKIAAAVKKADPWRKGRLDPQTILTNAALIQKVFLGKPEDKTEDESEGWF